MHPDLITVSLLLVMEPNQEKIIGLSRTLGVQVGVKKDTANSSEEKENVVSTPMYALQHLHDHDYDYLSFDYLFNHKI